MGYLISEGVRVLEKVKSYVVFTVWIQLEQRIGTHLNLVVQCLAAYNH